MPVAPSIPIAAFAGLLLLVGIGCQQQQQGFSEAEKADIRDSWYPKSQQVIQPGSTELAEGAAPLIYQVPAAGNMQVTDAATGQPLAMAAVSHGTIIRIDQEKGIYAGSRQLRPGPLEPGMHYGILLSVPQTNQWQSRVEAPHPAPPPATRPANEKESGPLSDNRRPTMRFATQFTTFGLMGLLAAIAIGCQGRAAIPSGAHLEQSGSGGLSYTAHQAGDAYVLDADKNTKVFEGHMNNGDQLVVNPDQDRIVLAGNNAEHNVSLKPGHRYEIYFTPAQ